MTSLHVICDSGPPPHSKIPATPMSGFLYDRQNGLKKRTTTKAVLDVVTSL